MRTDKFSVFASAFLLLSMLLAPNFIQAGPPLKSKAARQIRLRAKQFTPTKGEQPAIPPGLAISAYPASSGRPSYRSTAPTRKPYFSTNPTAKGKTLSSRLPTPWSASLPEKSRATSCRFPRPSPSCKPWTPSAPSGGWNIRTNNPPACWLPKNAPQCGALGVLPRIGTPDYFRNPKGLSEELPSIRFLNPAPPSLEMNMPNARTPTSRRMQRVTNTLRNQSIS